MRHSTVDHHAPLSAACWLRPCTSHPPPRTSLTSRAAALPVMPLELRRRLPLGVLLLATKLGIRVKDEPGLRCVSQSKRRVRLGLEQKWAGL
jgi:hypothetical protein